MTNSVIDIKNVDIYVCPKAETLKGNQLTIGDLHANAMLFLFHLVKNGVVTVSDEQYTALENIYTKETHTAKDVQEFNGIIKELKIGATPLVRLIGDEIADRGKNDYFMYKILEKLKDGGVKTESILSNHSIEFIAPYEQSTDHKTWYAPLLCYPPNQSRSLSNMRNLIENEIVTKEEVDALVKKVYLPQLKLLSYTLDKNDLTIHSHAGIDLEVIEQLTKLFNISYKYGTAEELATTIDSINRSFSTHVEAGTVHTLAKKLEDTKYATKKDPITFMLWNRTYSGLNRNNKHHGYTLNYVHGHGSLELWDGTMEEEDIKGTQDSPPRNCILSWRRTFWLFIKRMKSTCVSKNLLVKHLANKCKKQLELILIRNYRTMKNN